MEGNRKVTSRTFLLAHSGWGFPLVFYDKKAQLIWKKQVKPAQVPRRRPIALLQESYIISKILMNNWINYKFNSNFNLLSNF